MKKNNKIRTNRSVKKVKKMSVVSVLKNKKNKNNIKPIKSNKKEIIKMPKIDKIAEKNKEIQLKLTEKKEKAKILLEEEHLKEYLAKNVGSNANGILALLLEGPNVDDKVADFLKLKLNETRRMLNLLNNFGLVKYNINKDANGWLTFIWYLDFESVGTFGKKIKEISETKTTYLPEDCNDFFICKNCSKTHTIVIPFETAFDSGFKCVCGKEMTMIEKTKAEELYSSFNKTK